MSFQSQQWVKKTKKEHICDGCLLKIPVGSSAKRGAGIFEGEFYSFIICKPCDEFLTENRNYFEEGWGEGDIGMARKERSETA